MGQVRVAVIQLTSTDQITDNLSYCEQHIRRLAEHHVDLIVLPETFAFMGEHMRHQLIHSEVDGNGLIQQWLSNQARLHGIHLLAGSVSLQAESNEAENERSNKVRAASLLYDPQGERLARYDKMHLFDVSVPQEKTSTEQERYQESSVYDAGDRVVVCDTKLGKIGLSICYDLRFPELYRAQQQQGVELICVPSAFTYNTGKVHWQALLQARAIENQAYVIAAAQTGTHVSGRQTYGHSMVVDPWGEIILALGQEPSSAWVDIDLDYMSALRQQFPSLKHRRL